MFANKGPSRQGYGFSSGHVWLWELDCKESWAQKNRCFWTVVLKKTLESRLHCRRSNHSILKEISPECSLEGLMLKLKLQYSGSPDVRNWLIWKDPDAEKDLMQEEKGVTEDEMVGWHHRLNGWVWASSGRWWWTGRPGVLWFMGSQSQTRLSNWTELNWWNLRHGSWKR